MQIDYDSQSDEIYIRLRDGKINDTLEAGEDGVLLGLGIPVAGRLVSEDEIAALEEAMIDDNPVLRQGILEARAAYAAGDCITLDEYVAKLDQMA